MSGALAAAFCLVTYLCAIQDPVVASVPKELKHRHKSIMELVKRQQMVRIPASDLDVDKDDVLGKRQEMIFDDYGHMRFGKREESDDYGHLRFGRGGDSLGY